MLLDNIGMSYLLVTNAKVSDIIDTLRKNDHCIAGWENEKVDLVLEEADGLFTEKHTHIIDRKDFRAVRVAIRYWTGGSELDVERKAMGVVKGLKKPDNSVYSEYFDISTNAKY